MGNSLAEKNKINVSQICAIFLTVIPLTKIITAPSIFSYYLQEKLWQPLVLIFFVDIILLFLLIFISKQNENEDFYQILVKNYGKVFAKIVLSFFVLYFLLKAFIPIIEHKELIDNVLYETLPHSTIFYPAFILLFYLALKGLKSYARAVELCFFLTITGILIVLALSFPAGNLNYMLPLFKGTTKTTFTSTLKLIFWFNDSIYFIIFMGHFKVKKHLTLKIGTSYLISVLSVILFFVVFYSVFRSIAPTQKIAVSNMSIFSISLANVGRFDHIAIFILTISSLFAVSLPIIGATKFLREILNTKTSLIPAIIVCLILFVFVLLFATKYEDIIKFYTKFTIPFFVFCGYILPLVLLRRKKVEI